MNLLAEISLVPKKDDRPTVNYLKHKLARLSGERQQMTVAAMQQNIGNNMALLDKEIELLRSIVEELDKAREMAEDFKKINDLIYATGLSVGSDKYFEVREICTKHMKKDGKETKG